MDYKLGYFINILDYADNPITDIISQFKYKFSEEEDDLCEIIIESSDPKIADRKNLKEGKSFRCTWGWYGGSLSKQRTVYIFDRETQYKEDGAIQLRLICHERFALGKMDSVSNKNLSQLKDGAPIMFSSNVIANINLSGSNELKDFLAKNNIKDPRPNELKGTYNKDNITVSHYNGNMSTYFTLRNFLDRLPGGPYVMDSRDDGLLIRTRNFGNKSTKTFTWKGGTGELVKFTPVTKNRSRKASSSQVSVSTYDPATKKATNVTSTTEDTSQVKLASEPSLKVQIKSIEQLKLDAIGLAPNPGKDAKIKLLPYKFSPISDPKTQPILTLIEKNKGKTNYGTTTEYKDFNGKVIDSGLVVKTARLSNENNIVMKILAVGNHINGVSTDPGVANRDHTAMPKDNFAMGIIQENPSKHLPSNDTPEKAAAYASNTRKENELENNPGTAELLGQPELECGQIITILGVANLHIGNYYMSEVEHNITDGNYITNVHKLMRDGVTGSGTSKQKKLRDLIPGNPNLDPKATKTIINNSQGPEASNLEVKKKVVRKTPDKA